MKQKIALFLGLDVFRGREHLAEARETLELLLLFQKNEGEVFITCSRSPLAKEIALLESKGLKFNDDHILVNMDKNSAEGWNQRLDDLKINKEDAIVVDLDSFCYGANAVGIEVVACSFVSPVPGIIYKAGIKGYNL